MPNVSNPQVTIRTTAGSLTDAVMEVYVGPTCSSMTYIVCEDDNSDGNGSTMPVINLQGGPNNTIWVRVWGYNGSVGTFSICVFNYYSSNFAGDDGENTILVPVSSEQFEVFERVSENDVPIAGSEDLSSRLRITPNPANDALNVSFFQTENCQASSIVLSDLSGKIMLKQVWGHPDASEISERLEVAGFVPGIYVLQIITDKGIASKKVIIAHN